MGTPVPGFHSLQRHQFGENQRQQSAAVQFYKAFGRYGGEQDLVQLVGDALFGDDIDDLMMLCEADITSKNEARKQKFLDNFKLVRQKLKDLEEKDRIRNFQPPVDGEEIMRIFDLQPCREIGSLKSSIKDAILDGIIPNEHDAALEHMLKKAKSMGLTPKNL